MSIISKKALYGASIALFLSGCVSGSITSNKGETMKGPYKSIYIVMHTDIHVEPFSAPLIENIKKDFSQRNIALKTYVMVHQEKESLSLDPVSDNQKIDAEIREFQPDAILFMALTKIESTSGIQIGRPGSDGATFDLKLFQSGDAKTPVWRASYQVYGNSGISMAVGKGTKILLAKLEEDNIITK